jgi:CMP-N-acetylneuraminic acid synthetase
VVQVNNSGNAMSFTAILPIKFNSERVPRKNFRDFLGLPLYLHIIRNLLEVQPITKIVINTDAPMSEFDHKIDDPRIEFSKRPEYLLGETVSMNSIIEYEINRTGDDLFFMTHTTNPLLSSSTIHRMLQMYNLENSNNDSVVSVSKFFGRFLDIKGHPLNHNPVSLLRTQDLEPVLFENSCGYVFSKQSFSNAKSRIGSNPLFFETPKLESVDIDEEDDWKIAEALAEYGKRNV